MLVNIIEASEKLESALNRINKRIEILTVYNDECCNLIDIKTDLERLELYIESMKLEYLMNEALDLKGFEVHKIN